MEAEQENDLGARLPAVVRDGDAWVVQLANEIMAEARLEHSVLRIVDVEQVRFPSVLLKALTERSLAGRLMAQLIGSKDREHFVVLHLDARNRPFAFDVVSVGTLSSALVHPREVFKSAILNNATSIIIGHNHPSGDLVPSSEDSAVLERLTKAGEVLGIRVLDAFVVSGTRSLSLME